jgi:hypothetical protein
VFSPNWSGDRGAVTWFDQAAGTAGVVGSANSLIGSAAGDQVGSGYWANVGSKIVINSPQWNNGEAPSAGAMTWASAGSPLFGAVSAANSLVGSNLNDRVGNNGVKYLDGVHYAVLTPSWNGNRGAVTWIDSAAPVVGPIDGTLSGNSLTGTTSGDQVGGGGFVNLGSGKSLVFSPNWTNGTASAAGAVTWFDNTTGSVGPVGSGNSLVGSSTNDQVGGFGSYQFVGSKIAIRSPSWDNTSSAPNAGAITWAAPAVGITGALSAANSLVGDASGDQVGNSTIQFLGGGNYYVSTPTWHSSTGAVTWISSTAPPVGAVSAGNSLVGSSAGDGVGSAGVYNLSGGKHLVFSPAWNASRGAVTWFDDAAGTQGAVGSGNSLVGSTAGDQVGSGYWDTLGSRIAILSPNWNNGGSAAAAGALTWADAGTAMTGPVTVSNSLVGGSANDRVGNSGIDFLTSTLSVVRSINWSGNAGAATWITNAAPLTGLVSSGNSLVGSSANDFVGSGGVSYGSGYEVLRSSSWNGNRGAVTWIDGLAPVIGVVSSLNSLVGVDANDSIGNFGVNFFANGNYYVRSSSFNNSAGAVTIGAAAGGISGAVSGANSLVGQAAGDGYGSLVTVLTNSRLLVRATSADSGGLTNNGRAHIYSGAISASAPAGPLGSQSFGDNSSSSVTITPSQITAITNTGTAVVLQANSDITLEKLSDIISDNPRGDGGDLTLQAGRSVLIKSKIITDNGNLVIIGNDRSTSATTGLSTKRLPSGATTASVSAPDRDSGVAEITMADGTLFNTGTGNVTIHLRDGLGRSGAQAAAGDITLRSITAANLSVINDLGGIKVGDPAATAPSDIVIARDATLTAATTIGFFGGPSGAFAQLTARGTLSISPSPSLVDGGSFARIIRPSAGPGSDLLDTITASLLSLNPNLLDQIEDTKKSKGEIEIEVGETCK